MTLPSWVYVHGRTAFVILAAVGSALVARRLWRGAGDAPLGCRRRWVLGVPWGTVLTVLGVVAVYLFVQGGYPTPRRVLVLPFRAWSYFYPVGILVASFGHNGLTHLIGNMVGTLAYASIAEYALGHYPTERGGESFGSWRTNPYVRLAAVPAAALVVGLFTALFSLGPVIGFSGVVFAFAGFAIVTRPLAAALALLGLRVVNLVVSALRNPTTVTDPSPAVTLPWWAGIAIQDHLIGLLLGVLVGLAVVRRRNDWPSPRVVWFAALAFVVGEGLWAIYVPVSGNRYELFRWLGAGLVFVLVTVLTVGVTRVSPPTLSTERIRVADVAVVAIAVVLVAAAAPAVLYNVAPVDQQPGPEPSIQVRGYDIGYAENVPDGYIEAVGIPGVAPGPTVRTSGVIVTNSDRYIWETRITKATLANQGRSYFQVGGVGWRAYVVANRTGWAVTGNHSVYTVHLDAASASRTLAYTSEPAEARPIVAGRNVTVRPGERFSVAISRGNRTLGTAPVPGNGSATNVGGLTIMRRGDRLLALGNGSRVTVATRE